MKSILFLFLLSLFNCEQKNYFEPKLFQELNQHLYATHPLIYQMYGRHPALPANLALNYYSPYQNPYLYQMHGNSLGPMNIYAAMMMNPMMSHWFNPYLNPTFNPFQPYPLGREAYFPSQLSELPIQNQE